MFYSDDFIEEVRSRNDIVDVISSCVNLKRAGSNYKGLCPFHNEKSPSFMVSPGKQMYHCFGCGVGGNVITFVMEYENMTFVEALRFLAERAGMDMPEGGNSVEERKKRDIREQVLEIHKVAANFYYAMLKSPQGKEAYTYLKNRELSDDTITKFGLGYSGKSGSLYQYLKRKGYNDEILNKSGLFSYDERRGAYDKFWNRVMYPILDRNSKVIAFGGRVMGDGLPKYLNSPETMIFDKSRNLYGLSFTHGKSKDGLILCEGYMDVIALHQAGFTNAVASLGTAFTSQHSSLIKRYTDHVYLCYDSDGAGVKAALRAIPILKEAGISVKVIDMQPYKDPDEFMKGLSPEEFQKRIDDALNSFFYEVKQLERGFDMNDPEEKTKFMKEAAKKCLAFENEIERNNYMEAFARAQNVRSDDFKKLVSQMAAKMVGIHYQAKRPVRNDGNKKEKEDGLVKAQRILLTWLTDDPRLFVLLKETIEADDFTEEPYHQVAQMLFEQMEQEDGVNPARIISCFESKEEQSLVASLFSTDISDTLENRDREKAINDVVIRIKKASLDTKSRNVTDLGDLTKIVEEKKKLEKLHISLPNG